MADCEGDVPLRARVPNLSSTGLEEIILAPSGLKDVDNSLVVAIQVDELVRKLRSPQLEGQCSIESLEMADEGVVPEDPGQEGGVIGSARCEGSTAGHAGVNVQVYRVPVILVDEERTISGVDEMIKPGKIFVELGREGERSLFRALPESIQHPVEAGWRTHLGYIEQLAEKGAKLPEGGRRVANPVTHQ